MRLFTCLLVGSLATTALACGGSNGSPDGNTPGTDASGTDVPSGPDGTTPDDGGTDDGSVDDRMPMGQCTTGTALNGTCAAAVDLAAHGTVSGTTTTITGNNCSAPLAPMADVVGPSCAMSDKSTDNPAGYAVAFDYTMHAAGGLSVETDMGSDTNLDSIVWIADGCGTSAHELACNNDTPDGSSALSYAITTQGLAAGAHVKIFVAGYTPTILDGTVSASSFTLTVTEHALVAAGGPCDPTAPFCVDGSSCVVADATAATGTCRANGSEGAACNVTGAACSGTSATGGLPLGCTNPMPVAGDPGICLGINPNGGVCTADDPVCNTSYTCIADTEDGQISQTMGHCRLDGSLGGACGAAMHCDMGTCDADSMLCM